MDSLEDIKDRLLIGSTVYVGSTGDIQRYRLLKIDWQLGKVKLENAFGDHEFVTDIEDLLTKDSTPYQHYKLFTEEEIDLVMTEYEDGYSGETP